MTDSPTKMDVGRLYCQEHNTKIFVIKDDTDIFEEISHS